MVDKPQQATTADFNTGSNNLATEDGLAPIENRLNISLTQIDDILVLGEKKTKKIEGRHPVSIHSVAHLRARRSRLVASLPSWSNASLVQ